jgi:putative ABC transport system permease protein
VDAFLRDLRHGFRALTAEPSFTILAVATLALGIGAATAIFTVVDSVLLRPLQYKDPGRIVVALHGPEGSSPVSPADFLDYRAQARCFEALSVAQAWGVTLGGDRPERIAAMQVTADLFDLLGVAPILGRTFAEGEDHAGANQVAVLGYGLWQRHFAGDPSIVNRTVTIDGRPFLVVGVMPPTFRFAPFWQTRAELWAPISLDARRDDRDGRSLRLFGRLKDDVTVAQAQEEMSAIAARLERDYPATNTGVSIKVQPLLDKAVAGIRGTLLALLGMVVFVLLISCANVASAMLARASARQQDTSVRLALGATPWRIVRHGLSESVLLSVAGAVCGLGLAIWGVRSLTAWLPPGSLPRQQDVGFDVSVYVATTVATLAAAVITGLVPAVQAVRPNLVAALQEGGRGSTDGGLRRSLRSLLIAAEVALALALLVGATLMGQTMRALSDVNPGFRVDHLAVADVSLAGTPYAAPEARYAMYDRVRERLRRLPGVTSVSAINHLPLAGDVWTLGYTVEGRPAPSPGSRWSAIYRVVAPGYFATSGLPLIEGRDFSTADNAATLPVVIVSRSMAARRWPGASALGQRIRLPGPANVQAPLTVVGIAADARQGSWTSAPADEVYVALAQRATEFGLSSVTFLMRTSGDPHAAAASVPSAVFDLDRGVPVSSVTTMDDVVGDALWRQRLTARLTGLFALVALLLAAVGIYAAVSYAMGRRTREFGVRAVLGGTPRELQRLALVEGLRPVVVGTCAGIALSLAASRLIEGLLIGVTAVDPLSFLVAVLVLMAAGAGAAWLPARRASRQDPLIALRQP